MLEEDRIDWTRDDGPIIRCELEIAHDMLASVERDNG